MEDIAQHKVWVEINKDSLVHNIKEFKRLLGTEVKMMGVVKSNAYGHDLKKVSKICVQEEVDWLGVDSIDEALELREAGIKIPILILGYTLLGRLAEVVKNDINLIVYNTETIEKLGEVVDYIGKGVNVHLKVETGTSRQGIFKGQILDFIKTVQKYPLIKIRGISTHYANIEDTTDHSYAAKQLSRFNEIVKLLEKNNIHVPIKHTACSAAAILFPETHFNLARVGISLYGLWSSGETIVSAKDKKQSLELKPVLTWKTKVAQIKTIKSGTPVSYGLTEKVSKETRIAILPIGYWDGYDRRLSSIGNVLIKGQRCKVLGRVCMNIIVVDVSHLKDLRLEEEVVLLGGRGSDKITAEEIAGKLNTINYEVVARINPLIKRIYK